MTEKESLVDNEIAEHVDHLNNWISRVGSLTVSESNKGVIDRFIKDCNTLIVYVNEKEDPSMSDLVDFTDRRNSLGIQFDNIVDSYS